MRSRSPSDIPRSSGSLSRPTNDPYLSGRPTNHDEKPYRARISTISVTRVELFSSVRRAVAESDMMCPLGYLIDLEFKSIHTTSST